MFANAGDMGSIPGSERSPEEGNGNSLQYSCQENLMDRGAWRATVHWVAKSPTWLQQLTSMQVHEKLPFENYWDSYWFWNWFWSSSAVFLHSFFLLTISYCWWNFKMDENAFLSHLCFSSVQFSHSVVSNSLRPHELQHARPPCPSPTPRVHSDSRP